VHRPKFCRQCASPFPWTASYIAAAEKCFKNNALGLSDEEIEAIVFEKPEAELIAAQVREKIEHVSPGTKKGLKNILSNITSKAIVKLIFGR
jgi:hypothetical protein